MTSTQCPVVGEPSNWADVPRSHSSFSETPTLVTSPSDSTPHSKDKVTPTTRHKSSPRSEQPTIRSMFPQYDPDLPLNQQPYYPIQSNPPRNIARITTTRLPHSPSSGERSSSSRYPLSAASTTTITNLPSIPSANYATALPQLSETSSTEELKQLWRVLNGWRVSPSEGRKFHLKMTSSIEMPVHTLSSATQPFYTLRLDPTSVSAAATLSRFDPYKARSPSATKLSNRFSTYMSPTTSPTDNDVLRTTLEAPSRRLPPKDGLIAILNPYAATALAASTQEPQPHLLAAAGRESACLMYDSDSSTNYLSHAALAIPFSIETSSSPAWSKVEYSLEHPQLKGNLVKLVRDGAGGGWMEIDTGIASMIDSYYILDVAVSAVLLVAIGDENRRKIERFEAPPTRLSSLSSSSSPTPQAQIEGIKRTTTDKSSKRNKDRKFEEMELDLETQSSLRKDTTNSDGSGSGFLGFIVWTVKTGVWVVGFFLKGFAKTIIWACEKITKQK